MISVRRLSVALLSSLALLSGLLGPAASAAPPDLHHGSVTIFDVGFDSDRGLPSLRSDDAVIRVDGDLSRVVVPAGLDAQYAFLGTEGTTLHQMPAQGTPRLPGLSWSTERLAAELPDEVAAVTSDVRVDVTIDGPGDVTAFSTDAAGAVTRHFDTREPGLNAIPIGTDSTQHANWVFTRPGEYGIRAQPVLVTDSGDVRGDVETYAVVIDPASSTPTPHAAPTSTEPQACFDVEVPASGELFTTGHFDFGVQVKGGALLPRVKNDETSPAQWRRPEDTYFRVDDSAARAVPTNRDFAFLGAAGDRVWTIGQSQQDGIPWLGWNTQYPTAINEIDGPTTWTLDSVEGPGDLFVYQVGSLGELEKVLSTSAGWPRSLRIPPNVHAHGNWSFTKPGAYTITSTHTAQLRTGATVTASSELTFLVGPCATDAPRPEPTPTTRPTPKASDDPSSKDGTSRPPGTTKDAGTSPLTDDAAKDQGAAPSVQGSPLSPAVEPCREPSPGTPTDGTGPGDSDGTQSGTTVHEGHFDFGAQIAAGKLVPRVKDDRSQPPAWVDPASFVFALGDRAKQKVPETDAYSFLGKPGSDVWMIQQTQATGVPWLGWNTQDTSMRSQVSGPVTFTLDGVTGPGQLAVYLTDSFGGVGEKKFGNVTGFPKSFTVPLNVHAHGNWAFTKPGSYRVTMTQSATLTNGKKVSGQATLAFRIGAAGAAGASSVQPATATSDPGLTVTQPGDTETSAPSEAPAVKTTGTDCALASAGAAPSLVPLTAVALALILGGTAATWRARRRPLAA